MLFVFRGLLVSRMLVPKQGGCCRVPLPAAWQKQKKQFSTEGAQVSPLL
jgi:hypothetical protein